MSQLQQIATDRNLFLQGTKSEYTVYTADGVCLAVASTPVAALTIAIFGGK